MVSPTLINEVRIGFNRFNVVDTANSFGIDENNILGIPKWQYSGTAVYVRHCAVQHLRIFVHRRSRVDRCRTHCQYL